MSVALALLSRASGGTGSAGAGYHEGRGGLALAEHHAGRRDPYANLLREQAQLQDRGQLVARLACRLGDQHGLSPGTHQARRDPPPLAGKGP